MGRKKKERFSTTCPHCGTEIRLSAREVERADFFECSDCGEFFDANISVLAKTSRQRGFDSDDGDIFSNGDDPEGWSFKDN